MEWRVIASQAAVVFMWLWFIVFYEVPINIRLIKADGSNNSLGKGFHSRRTWVRVLWALPMCLLGAAAVGWLVGWGRAGWGFGALLVLIAGIFFRTFGPLLSVGMALDYKMRFYASPVSASLPDAYIWWWVRRNNKGVPDSDLQQRADEANHSLLNYVGLTCLLAYAYCTWRIFAP